MSNATTKDMREYDVTVEEIMSRTVTVLAASPEDAKEKVWQMIRSKEVVLTKKDSDGDILMGVMDE